MSYFWTFSISGSRLSWPVLAHTLFFLSKCRSRKAKLKLCTLCVHTCFTVHLDKTDSTLRAWLDMFNTFQYVPATEWFFQLRLAFICVRVRQKATFFHNLQIKNWRIVQLRGKLTCAMKALAETPGERFNWCSIQVQLNVYMDAYEIHLILSASNGKLGSRYCTGVRSFNGETMVS